MRTMRTNKCVLLRDAGEATAGRARANPAGRSLEFENAKLDAHDVTILSVVAMIALLLASCSSAISPSRYAELGVVRVVSSPPSAPPVGPPESALAVSHRESVLGCHSFDRFLHPRWETFFLFQREFAQAWRLEQLVMSAASRTSRGAHLVEFLRLPPQMAAQLLVLQLLSERDAAPETLVACSCDVHALPTWHAQHTPFRVLVERLHGALLVDTASRQSRDGSRAEHFGLADLRRWNAHIKQSDTCMRRFEKERRKPLLAACALLIETLPANDTLVGARLHGGDPDVGGWSQRGGHSGYRPSDLPEGEQWLMDSSMWLPDRFCAYNASLLAPELERMRFVSGTLVDAPRTWSAIVCSSRLGAVRSNDGEACARSAECTHGASCVRRSQHPDLLVPCLCLSVTLCTCQSSAWSNHRCTTRTLRWRRLLPAGASGSTRCARSRLRPRHTSAWSSLLSCACTLAWSWTTGAVMRERC